MISHNPLTGAAYGCFELAGHKPVYWVVEARNASAAFVCVGDAQTGPVAAKLSGLDTESPRIEFAEPWRPNAPRWKAAIRAEALRVIAGKTHGGIRYCEG